MKKQKLSKIKKMEKKKDKNNKMTIVKTLIDKGKKNGYFNI